MSLYFRKYAPILFISGTEKQQIFSFVQLIDNQKSTILILIPIYIMHVLKSSMYFFASSPNHVHLIFWMTDANGKIRQFPANQPITHISVKIEIRSVDARAYEYIRNSYLFSWKTCIDSFRKSSSTAHIVFVFS